MLARRCGAPQRRDVLHSHNLCVVAAIGVVLTSVALFRQELRGPSGKGCYFGDYLNWRR